jgi:hypothetical protein
VVAQPLAKPEELDRPARSRAPLVIGVAVLAAGAISVILYLVMR